MKRSMRGVLDPYGISLILALIGAFLFEAQVDEQRQTRHQLGSTPPAASIQTSLPTRTAGAR